MFGPIVHYIYKGRGLDRISSSTFCPLYRFVNSSDREFFRSSILPIGRARVFFQLFTINSRYQSIFIDGVSHRFCPFNQCGLCNSNDFDTVVHFLLNCPIISVCRPARMTSGVFMNLSGEEMKRVARLLCVRNEAEMEDLWQYLVDGLRLRRFVTDMMA